MHEPTTPRIFVTYDPSDLTFARELQAVLEASGLSLYRDLADLDGAPAWWWQVETTIKAVDHVVVVLTPKALRSHYIPIEWRLALAEGKRVWLVAGPKRLRFSRLPRWMKQADRYNIAIPKSQERLIAGLRVPGPPRSVPFMTQAGPEVGRKQDAGATHARLMGEGSLPCATRGPM